MATQSGYNELDGCPYSYATSDLASCPSRDVCDDITLLQSFVPWKFG